MVAGEKLPQEGGGQGGGFCVGERAPGTLFELDEAQVRQADDDVAAVDQELAVDGVGMAGGHAHPEVGEVDLVFLPGQPPCELVPLRGLRFELKGLTGFSVESKKDEAGMVTELVSYQPNGAFVAKRK